MIHFFLIILCIALHLAMKILNQSIKITIIIAQMFLQR